MVVAASLLGVVLLRRRSHNDVHSVEGYHRQIHTLEVISEHPAGSENSEQPVGEPKHLYPESAVRLTDSTTVRLIGSPRPPVPPVAPPPVGDSSSTITFDALVRPPTVRPPESSPPEPSAPESSPAEVSAPESSSPGSSSAEVSASESSPAEEGAPGSSVPELSSAEVSAGEVSPAAVSPAEGAPPDRAVSMMNRRPRRLLAPGLAVAAVTVLVVVLLLAGSHTVPPRHPAASGNHHRTKGGTGPTRATTTTTAPAPIVSAPQSSTANAATYSVGKSTFTLVLAATSNSCWISVSNTAGANLFSATLTPGQTHSLPVTGPISVNVGAPSSFAATVNGAAVALPGGYQTPLTLNFTPAVAT